MRDRHKERYNAVSSRNDSSFQLPRCSLAEKTTNLETSGTVISTPDMTNPQPFLSRILSTPILSLSLFLFICSPIPHPSLYIANRPRETVRNILSYFPFEFSFTAGPGVELSPRAMQTRYKRQLRNSWEADVRMDCKILRVPLQCSSFDRPR